MNASLQRYTRFQNRILAVTVILLGVLTLLVGIRPSIRAQQEKPKLSGDIFPSLSHDGAPERIPPGSPDGAKEYYDKLGEKLSFPNKRVPENLDGLLEYFGFHVLRAADVDKLDSEVLMDATALQNQLKEKLASAPPRHEFNDKGKWDVLAARYFSPKTSDVSGLSKKISWRKVVRLRARPDSPADKDAVTFLYFLSVIYVKEEDLAKSPFKTPSSNIQVMLVADLKRPSELGEAQACWLVFDPTKNYQRSLFTATSWDAADPDLIKDKGIKDKGIKDKGDKPYYLPNACRACHGIPDKADKFASVQFFDTDYILDRVVTGDDFEKTVGRSEWGALFDAGREPYTPRFEKAFDVFRRLNKEIIDQNAKADPNSRSHLAAKNWMGLHKESSLHVPPIRRGITEGVVDFWIETKEPDKYLLPLLNRYCYRCHGSFHYNVYNKAEVLGKNKKGKLRKDDMIERINGDEYPFRMPHDRNPKDPLPKEVKEELTRLLKQL